MEIGGGTEEKGSKPVLSVYDIRRKRIVKCRQGDYEDIWGDLSWGGEYHTCCMKSRTGREEDAY